MLCQDPGLLIADFRHLGTFNRVPAIIYAPLASDVKKPCHTLRTEGGGRKTEDGGRGAGLRTENGGRRLAERDKLSAKIAISQCDFNSS